MHGSSAEQTRCEAHAFRPAGEIQASVILKENYF
jgi:hypothetical protein